MTEFTFAPGEKFQSTLSMRRATTVVLIGRPFVVISIHALHEESDRSDPV